MVRGEVLHQDDPANIQLRIPSDNAAEFAQWFHFRLQGAAGVPVTLRFMNASACAYPKGWDGYQVVASHDRQHWFRIATTYDGTVMTASTTPDTNSIYFAYFEPYSWDRHLDLIGSVAASEHVQVEHLGQTLDRRDLNLLRIADASSAVPEAQRKKIWVIARQHPGETMAEWFVEGFLERLLDTDDPSARVLLDQCVFYVVPNMNPDGSVRGNLRTNAVGSNLNREWLTPTMEKSPEVFLVRARMQQTGVDRPRRRGAAGQLRDRFGGHCRVHAAHQGPAGCVQDRVGRSQPGFPDPGGLWPRPRHPRQPHPGHQLDRPEFRLPGLHARDAVQGQRRAAGCGAWMERGAVEETGRQRVAADVLGGGAVAITFGGGCRMAAKIPANILAKFAKYPYLTCICACFQCRKNLSCGAIRPRWSPCCPVSSGWVNWLSVRTT